MDHRCVDDEIERSFRGHLSLLVGKRRGSALSLAWATAGALLLALVKSRPGVTALGRGA
jgi:hypothetical protein